MNFRILVSCLIYIPAAFAGIEYEYDWTDNPKSAKCLTGYMTDSQPWVDAYGHLTDWGTINFTSIKISSISSVGALATLQEEMASFRSSASIIRYLSMTHCGLTRIPPIFQMQDNNGRSLSDTIEFATFYGNNFGNADTDSNLYDASINATEATEVDSDIDSIRRQLTQWSVGFRGYLFRNLKELDLRACSINALGSNTFQRMPKLRRLYLGENNIHYVEVNAFSSLANLKHLDLSRNFNYDENGQLKGIIFENLNVFRNMSLETLDLSFTYLGVRNIGVLNGLKPTLKILSICHTGLDNIRHEEITLPPLKFLDVSGNKNIINSSHMFRGLNDKLKVLYAEDVALKDMEFFKNFSKLEVLQLTDNEISSVSHHVAETLTSLQILDLDGNRLLSWSDVMFSWMPKLKLLSLRNNLINLITKQMYDDFKKLQYIGLSANFLVCNCYARDIYEVGLKNEYTKTAEPITGLDDDDIFHMGFKQFNDIIRERHNITSFCGPIDKCDIDFNPEINGNYLLLDYDENYNAYDCLMSSEGKTIAVHKFSGCGLNRGLETPEKYVNGWNKYLLFIIPGLLLPMVFYVYTFRKNLRYFMIMIRNSATLSLINKKNVPDEEAIFNYDVFVSYCNEDRAWVLDQLLPHVERDCNISVCLHERDFQVGLSILENIVSCMDRSRSIMLIISKRFLLSQWCQFEMHLAQHRLLETRREDLILILLEEIPRRLRPNTLHYLMLTKTYIVWPKDETEQTLFWKRMKKSLITHKLKHQENVSLA